MDDFLGGQLDTTVPNQSVILTMMMGCWRSMLVPWKLTLISPISHGFSNTSGGTDEMKKSLHIDIIFFIHLLVILPGLTFFYMAISVTNYTATGTAVGLILLWIILIPYPMYWYWANRLKDN